MISCTRRIQFCAGHRVFGHEGKCQHIHGHNYVALITAHANDLDSIGRVIDFSVLKDKIGGWIDRNWDHGCIFWSEDKDAINGVSRSSPSKVYHLPDNPTAENMARYLLEAVAPGVLSDLGVVARRVAVWETDESCAVATLTGDGGGLHPPLASAIVIDDRCDP